MLKNLWYYFINILNIFYSFLIPPEVYPGRIALLLTTLLVLINIFIGIMQTTPMSGQINQMQFWLMTCIIFVIMSVFIYALILAHIQFPYGICKTRNPSRHVLDNIGIIIMPIVFIFYAVVYNVSILTWIP